MGLMSKGKRTKSQMYRRGKFKHHLQKKKKKPIRTQNRNKKQIKSFKDYVSYAKGQNALFFAKESAAGHSIKNVSSITAKAKNKKSIALIWKN